MIKKWQISFAIILMLLGILFSFQFRTQQNILSDLKEQKTEDLLVMVDNLDSKNSELIRQQTELKLQLDILKKSSNEGQLLAQSLNKDMSNMDIALGIKPVTGNGIIITIDYYIDPDQLPSIINDLWNSGAEAISVNDIRINYKSTFSNDKNGLATINNITLAAPLIIKAIGPPDKMARSTNMPGRDLNWINVWVGPVDIKQVDTIELKAVDKPPTFNVAKIK